MALLGEVPGGKLQLFKFREMYEKRYHDSIGVSDLYKMKDVGHLVVKVIKAQGLSSADIGGKSDPFAVLEVGCNFVQILKSPYLSANFAIYKIKFQGVVHCKRDYIY